MPKYACSWGWLEVDGKRYENDVVVHVDGSVTAREIDRSRSYRGEYFHVPLSENELGFVEKERPEVVIVGGGHKGMLVLTPKAKELLSGYVVLVGTTERAVELMNQEKRRFVAVLHSKC
jgi:hypothetical protein